MFKFSEDFLRRGITYLENSFIVDYLSSTDTDFIKVYIYISFLCQNHKETDFDRLVKDLDMDKLIVERALRFWERRRLLKRVSKEPLSYELLPISNEETPSEFDDEYIDFVEDLHTCFNSNRKLKNSEINIAYDWLNELKISKEIIIMLINQCRAIKGDSFSFNYANSIANALASRNIKSNMEAAVQFFNFEKQVHDGSKKVLNRLGQRRQATVDEKNLYSKWLNEYKFTEKDILDACKETVKATSPSFAYLDGILTRINKGKDLTVEETLNKQKEVHSQLKELRDIFGINRSLSSLEEQYNLWVSEFAFDDIKEIALFTKESGNFFDDVSDNIKKLAKLGLNGNDLREYLKAELTVIKFSKQILSASGMRGKPTDGDIEKVKDWKNTFSDELILFVAEQARDASKKFAYMSAIFDRMNENNIKTIEEAKQISNKLQSEKNKNTKKLLNAQAYSQRNIDEGSGSGDATNALLKYMEEQEAKNEQ